MTAVTGFRLVSLPWFATENENGVVATKAGVGSPSTMDHVTPPDGLLGCKRACRRKRKRRCQDRADKRLQSRGRGGPTPASRSSAHRDHFLSSCGNDAGAVATNIGVGSVSTSDHVAPPDGLPGCARALIADKVNAIAHSERMLLIIRGPLSRQAVQPSLSRCPLHP